MNRDALTLGLAIWDEQIHGVWRRGNDRVYSDAVPMGIRSLSESLKELLGKSRDQPENIVFGVPFQRMFMRSIDIPPAPDLPLGPFAEQFAATELPYPIEEALLDYSVFESETERRLLLVAGQKKDFEPYRAALDMLAAPARIAIPLSMACFRSADVPESVRHLLLVYFWKTHIELLWCSSGRPRHLRHVPIPRARLIAGVTSKDPDVLSMLSSEIRVSAEFIRKQSGANMSSLMACVASCDRLFDDAPALLQPDVPFTIRGKLLDGPEGTMLADGACRVAQDGALDVNLFSPKKSNAIFTTVPRDKKNKLMVSALAAILLILVLTIIKTVVSYTWVKNAESEHVEAAAGRETGLPEGASSQLAAFLSAPDAFDSLNALTKSIPADVRIQDVTIEAAQISARGTAPRAMDVYDALISGGFQDVRFLQEVTADPDDKDRQSFAIGARPPFAPAAESP